MSDAQLPHLFHALLSQDEVIGVVFVGTFSLCRFSEEDLRLLQELTSFIVRASIRVAELGNGAPTGGSENPGAGPTKAASPPES